MKEALYIDRFIGNFPSYMYNKSSGPLLQAT